VKRGWGDPISLILSKAPMEFFTGMYRIIIFEYCGKK